MRRLIGGLAVLLLGGCATAADIKPSTREQWLADYRRCMAGD